MNMRFEKISHNRLVDQVIERLQKQISLGDYKKGDKIPTEPALMQQFGVGRSTIREAIKTLANAGVLKVKQGSGTFVHAGTIVTEPLDQRLRRANVQEVNEVRHILEIEIVKKAACFRKTKDIKKMRDCLFKRREAIEADDYEACVKADIAFHIVVAEAGGNDVLADLYKSFARILQDSFNVQFSDVTEFKLTHQKHEYLLQTIIDEDPEKATCAILQILEH